MHTRVLIGLDPLFPPHLIDHMAVLKNEKVLDRTQHFQFPRGQQGLIKEIPKLFGPLESLSELLPHSKKGHCSRFCSKQMAFFLGFKCFSLSVFFIQLYPHCEHYNK